LTFSTSWRAVALSASLGSSEVEVEHHVVAHLERQVDLLHLLAGGGVVGLAGVERGDRVAQRRPVDLDEGQPQAAGDVFHQCGLAVAWGRDQEQEAHQVGALGVARGAHLLGQVVADQRQVDVVDQLVAHEGGQHTWFELFDAQAGALTLDQLADLLACSVLPSICLC
jgi:hypothetical protein